MYLKVKSKHCSQRKPSSGDHKGNGTPEDKERSGSYVTGNGWIEESFFNDPIGAMHRHAMIAKYQPITRLQHISWFGDTISTFKWDSRVQK
jgi:hypothetical protein